MKMHPVHISVLVVGLAATSLARQTKMPGTLFEYDASQPFDTKEAGVEKRDGVDVHDVTFANTSGGRTSAYLVTSAAAGSHAGILYVHWFEPESADSNRTQFLAEAVDNAKRGATSLLIDTMWSNPKWFDTRKQRDDYSSSVRQVKELRRALDFLLSQPRIDRHRVAYVGHDFGAMYGAVLSGLETRVRAYVLMAGTTAFSDWFLLGSKLAGAERQQFISQMAVLDPIRYIGAAVPSAVMFQFGSTDKYVPRSKAEAFFAAAREPKQALWYDAGHALSREAARNRQQWLKAQLGF